MENERLSANQINPSGQENRVFTDTASIPTLTDEQADQLAEDIARNYKPSTLSFRSTFIEEGSFTDRATKNMERGVEYIIDKSNAAIDAVNRFRQSRKSQELQQ